MDCLVVVCSTTGRAGGFLGETGPFRSGANWLTAKGKIPVPAKACHEKNPAAPENLSRCRCFTSPTKAEIRDLRAMELQMMLPKHAVCAICACPSTEIRVYW